MPSPTPMPTPQTISSPLPVATPMMSPTATPAQGAVKAPEQRVVDVKGLNFSFDKKEIRVKKGESVAVRFTNTEGFHDFVVEGLNVRTSQIPAGQTETIVIPTDKAGTYAYYCSVGQHRKMGMEGKLIVE